MTSTLAILLFGFLMVAADPIRNDMEHIDNHPPAMSDSSHLQGVAVVKRSVRQRCSRFQQQCGYHVPSNRTGAGPLGTPHFTRPCCGQPSFAICNCREQPCRCRRAIPYGTIDEERRHDERLARILEAWERSLANAGR